MEPVIRGDNLYVVVEGPTWEEAQQNALALNGNLVTINDNSENTFLLGVEDFWNDFTRPESGLYIGLYDTTWTTFLGEPNGGTFSQISVNGRDWSWVSGEEFDYNDWWLGQGGETMSIVDGPVVILSGLLPEGEGTWNDIPNDTVNEIPWGYEYEQENGIAEIPLNLSITTSDTPTEGAGVFTTSINLSAGSETSGNLAEGAEVFWSISGIDADDLESGALAGSGFITDGKLDIDLSLIQDEDTGESLEISVFSDADRNYQIGETQSFEIIEGEVDPITGTLGLPGKINLKNQGKTPFVLYGNEDLIFDTSDQDTLINPDTLGFGSNPGETLFTPATKKNGTTFASYEDVNTDGFLDYVVKVDTPMIASTDAAGEQEIVASATTNGGEDLLFSAPNAVLF